MELDKDSLRIYYVNVMLEADDIKRLKSTVPSTAMIIDNDGCTLMDACAYEHTEPLHPYTPALGEEIVLANTSYPALDGLKVTVVGYRTRYEVEGG